jgi:hypothetical protein
MYLRTDNFQYERNKRWVEASLGLERIEPFMIGVVQGLGMLDCKLVPEDGRYEQLSEAERFTIEEGLKLTDRVALSFLWVMGAYELIRTIAQRHRTDNIFVVGAVVESLKMLKRKLERLRIPLAKMESARAYPNDAAIPREYTMPGWGVAWRVSEGELISRRLLSDGLLGLVELMQLDTELQAQQQD